MMNAEAGKDAHPTVCHSCVSSVVLECVGDERKALLKSGTNAGKTLLAEQWHTRPIKPRRGRYVVAS